MMVKKWLSILILLGFASTYVYADDEDYDEEEEEEEPVKKSSKKKTTAKKSSSGESRMGLAVGFGGANEFGGVGGVSFIYDMGGMELGIGLGLLRYQYTPGQGDAPDPEQTICIIPSFSYELGKGLLNYGIGIDVGIIMDPAKGNKPDGGTSFYAVPNFYTSAELIKNLSLKLSAGAVVYKESADKDDNSSMVIGLSTSGTVIFYFL